MARKIAGVGDDAVLEATGKPWGDWIALLDDGDGTDLTHRERVQTLSEAGVDSDWWQQKIAVGYEQERGLREVGETADADYQIGVQRTLPVASDDLWQLLTTEEGRSAWLGEVPSLAVEPGATFETADGITGEIRTLSEGERIRLTWRPAERDEYTTVQLTLTCPRNDETKTVVRFHHERLYDTTEREAMRERWTAALDRLEELVESSAA